MGGLHGWSFLQEAANVCSSPKMGVARRDALNRWPCSPFCMTHRMLLLYWCPTMPDKQNALYLSLDSGHPQLKSSAFFRHPPNLTRDNNGHHCN